jgi:alpha-tubulin suppressor-like RCC1 family protein
MRSMNVTPADRSDVNRAVADRATIADTHRWHVLRKPYEEIDVLVGVNFPIRSGFTKVSAIAAASDVIVLSEDGTIDAWNPSAQGGVPDGVSGVTAIAAGDWLGLALSSNGKVTAWGDDSYGKATVPQSLSNVSAISSKRYHSLALRGDGTVVAWGYNHGNAQGSGPIDVPTSLSDVIAIETSAEGSLAKKSNGTFVAWGSFPSPPSWDGLTTVSAGFYHAAGLRSDGTMIAWGYNAYGATDVPPGLTDVAAVDCGYQSTYALKNDGTVVAWGDNISQTTIHPDIRGVTDIAAGYYHAILLKKAPRQP